MPTAKNRQRMSLADKVYHALQARIQNGDYPAGDRLPSEIQLSEDLGVSRPVLRSALERLREDGLVQSRQGAGTFVQAIPVVPKLGFARVETLADIQRTYEFRITLETQAAALAAERRNVAALERIDTALDLLTAATGSLQHREDADFMFHSAIAQAANNQYFETTFGALREHVNVGMKLHGDSLLNDGRKSLEDVLAEHTRIRDAIKAQDAEKARIEMRAHLEHSRDRLFGGGLLDLRMR